MSWERTLLVIIIAASILGLVVTSIYTGRDAPITLAGLLSTVLGIALGADAFLVVKRKENDDGGDDDDARRN